MPRIVGPIVLLQIQRDSLKVGEKGAKCYATDALLPLDRLVLAHDGVTGLVADGEMLDAHHRHHPLRKNDDGRHGVSVGFTSHYDVMRRRFGSHMTVGCAGENIIVNATQRFELDDVSRGLLLLDAAGNEKGRLLDVTVAHPCKPFTGFAHRMETVPADVFKESLQFLDGGLRGFYCTFAGPHAATIERGDLVAIAT